MKRTLAVFMAMILALQAVPFEAFADAAVTIREAQSVVTVSFGGDEYIFADGYTMEVLPEAEECERYIFDGWYDGDAKIEAPFTPKGDMVLEARYVHRGTLIAESGYTELWYTGDADVPSVTAVKALLPEGEEQLEVYIFAPASAAEVDIEFKASGRLYALDDSGAAAADLGWAEAGTGMTVSPQTVRGYCLAKAAEEKEAALVLSGKSGSGNVVLSVEKTEYAPALTSSSGEKVTEYETLYAASFAVTDGRGTPIRASAAVSYTDGAVLKAAVAGKRIVVLKDGEEIPFEIENDTLTFALSGQGRVGIYAFDDIVSWTWGQAPAAPGTRTAKSAAANAGEYRMSMSGMMPWGTSAAVETRKAVIPGEEVLYAAEFTLYNAYGYEIEPGNGPVQVTVAGAGIGEAESLRVFRVEGKETREITDVKVEGDRVTFGADAAGTYAVTETLEQIVSIGGATYKIMVAYGRDAMIPDGAELDVKEVSGDKYIADTAAALEVGEGDDIFYTKFLDISIVADGKVIEPQAPVQVTVELLDAEAGAEALEVVHFGDRGAEKVDAAADADGRVTFMADSFSTYGFGSVLRALLSWSSDAVTYTLQGFSSLLAPTYTAITVQAEEGLEALGAYRVDSLLGSLLNMLYVKVSAPVALGERESVAVYSVNDGEIGELLSEGTESGSVALGGADGFAVVKDTGYRNLNFDLGDVTLSGMMPKAAEAEAEGADPDALAGLEGQVLAAWDISILENGAEYQPDDKHPVSVSIALSDGADRDTLRVWHILDDGTNEEIGGFTVDSGRIVFTARGFSIYAITDEPDNANARIAYQFIYNDGTQDVVLSTQYFRYKDIHPASGTALSLHEPSLPGIDSSSMSRIFRGWSHTSTDDVDANLLNIAELNDELAAKPQSEFVEGEVIKVYANLKNVYYVTYVDVNPNNILATEIVPVAESGATTFSVKPESELRPTITADDVLQGWYDINDPGTVYTPGQQDVTLDKNVTLYPKVDGGWWLIFNDNDLVDDGSGNMVSGGASFTPPAFYLNEITNAPAEPTWNGYEFDGWYEDAACTTPFEFGTLLEHDTTVYAKWNPSDSSYRVIIWKQRATDAAGLDDDDKLYDYVDSFLFDEDVVTGQTATLDQRFTRIYGPDGTSDDTDKAYFVYNAAKTDQSVVINADGSSVLNVYYDRKPVNLDFHTVRYTQNNSGMLGRLNNGAYVRLGTRNSSNRIYYWSYGGNAYIGDYYTRNNGTYTRVTGELNYSNTYYGVINGYYTLLTRNEFTRGNSYRYNADWPVYKTFTGLYGSTLNANGYTWPDEYYWYANGDRYGQTSGTRTTMMTAFLPTDTDTSGDTVTVDFYGTGSSGSSHIYFYTQELDGSYSLKDTVTAGGGNFYISDKYIGYHAAYYSTNGNNWYGAGSPNSQGYYNGGNPVAYTDNLYILFDLNEYTLNFYTNNGSNQLISHAVPYSQSLEEYASQSPGQRTGHYFTGWFADPSCTTPFDFTQTMPDNNLAVYGKWRLRRVRVVVDPMASNVYMGSQAAAFRVDFDERVDGGLMESATRAGYILDGWYTDPDFTNRFLFSNPINDDVEGISWDYQEDRWTAVRQAYSDDDEEHDNVRGILHLYAKWILDTDSTGINVIYDPGEAALYDSLGNLLTTVPIDTHMYSSDGTSTAREAPSNYNELYTFKYWEAIKEDGTVVILHPGDPIPLSELRAEETIYDDAGEELRHSVKLRAVYELTGDPSRITHITYDGNTFSDLMYDGSTKEMRGRTSDGTERVTITLEKEVNQTIELPSSDDFYMNGWELTGWSFTEGPYAAQEAAADEDAPNFEPGQEVAADNLIISELNDEENMLYAMWQPKKYTVTVRQVIENGVPVNSFAYPHKTGVERNIASAQETVTSLTGNSSFTVEDLEYYDRVGHVIRITTPSIPEDAAYDVRVNAVVKRDDGTTETLNPTAVGDYQILGDVTITYTYSPKVLVTLKKRDATAHSTALSGAGFILTPVEFNAATNRWENAGAGKEVTVNDTLRKYLQEGTYRITESAAPENYALVSSDLFLTVRRDQPFILFNERGGQVSASVAELDSGTQSILTVYDNPIRTVTLSKTINDTVEPDKQFTFTVTVYDETGKALNRYDVGAGTTNNVGQLTLTLGDGGSEDLRIPHGYKLTVAETAANGFSTVWQWNNDDPVEGTAFGSASAPVTVTADSTLGYTNTRRYTLTYANLPDGSGGFTLTETQTFGSDDAEYTTDPEETVTLPDKTNLAPVGYRFAGWAEETDGEAVYQAGDAPKIGELPPDDSGDKILYAVWERLPALTVKKLVTGGWGDRERYFDFTMNVEDSAAGKKYLKLNPDGTSEVITADSEGRLSFRLKHSETFTVCLPEGKNVTIEEVNDTESSRYTTTWGEETERTKEKTVQKGAENETLTVTNRLEPVAPTGYHADMAPYLMMLLAGIALLLLRARRAAVKGGGAV